MIQQNQELKLTNSFSLRKDFSQEEMKKNLFEIKGIFDKQNLKMKSITTVSYSVKKDENNNIVSDTEIILTPEQKIDLSLLPDGFAKRREIHIVNALYTHYEGTNIGVQDIFVEISKYIKENNLQPVTSAYSVSEKPFEQPMNYVALDVYVGINPNAV